MVVSAELETELNQLKGYCRLRTGVMEDSRVGSSRNLSPKELSWQEMPEAIILKLWNLVNTFSIQGSA